MQSISPWRRTLQATLTLHWLNIAVLLLMQLQDDADAELH